MVDARAYLSHGSRVRAAVGGARDREHCAAPHDGWRTLSAAHADPDARHAVVGDDHCGPRVVAVYFFDSSALVKRYAQETGSAWVEALTDPQAGHGLCLARIPAVEVVAAVAHRQRGGALSAVEGTS